MMNKQIVVGGLLGALMVAGSAGYAGATCVNVKGKGGCFSSINAAIAATPAGGTITIAPGRYFEAVMVNKGGLTLTGSTAGAAIIDSYGLGIGIHIESKNVTVQTLTVENSSGNGIEVDESNAQLLGVSVLSSEGNAIYSWKANTQIRNSRIRAAGSDCIEVEGPGAVVADNNIGLCDGDGIYSDANGVKMNRNRILVADGGGVDVEANNNRANGNTVGPTYYESVYMDGDGPVANGNTAFSSWWPGVSVTCSGACSASTVSGNTVYNTTEDDGYELEADAWGFVADGNRATDVAYEGFNIGGSAPATFSHNQSVRAGDDFEDGFYDDGSKHSFVGNSASGTNGRGIGLYEASNITLQGNSVSGNSESGIVITETSSGVNLDGNVSNNNNQDGIVISTGSQVGNLTNNTALGNRADFCRAGTVTGINSGNNFGNKNSPNCIYP